jgi:hypothetical protein
VRTELDLAQLAAALDEWVGAEVAVRVVSGEDDLLAVAHGHLGPRRSGKHPALFWPVGEPGPGPEEPGIYLHPDAFEQASAREGEFVLELRQGGVTLNLRRL